VKLLPRRIAAWSRLGTWIVSQLSELTLQTRRVTVTLDASIAVAGGTGERPGRARR
jgi:hypothetical protein